MYLDYWGFKRFPFDNVPDPGFFYLSKPHEEGLTRLIYAAQMRKGCALLSGNIGCGKTTLSKVFLQKMSEQHSDIALISNPCIEPKEFLQDLLYKFQTRHVPDSKVEILRVLNDRLTRNMKEGKETLLVIDEAQVLTEVTLEEIRLLLNFQLSNRFLLTVFLFGQPELINKIQKIKQLEQRIAIKYLLRPFNLKETLEYVLFREKRAGAKKNVFTKEAIEMVYDHSGGLPRGINHLCDLSLLIGFSEKKKTIGSEIIGDILDDGTVF
ncbi:MAG: AAA family ATPase [Thermodesulfobacteriota bacterium]|nr:AAA family ATPase [Thermodesulfobacteriota bacterium]